MKAFVTGGTGFIGKHLIRKLISRGYEVYGLVRSDEGQAQLATLGAQAVFGDILDQESMRSGMSGSDLVFHLAGWYEIGSRDRMKAEAINVAGTRNVLRLAHELGVPKIIYVSSVAVFGDTRGRLVDETFSQGGPFVTEYDRTKWLAHYKVALPLIEQGAPIIITMPGVIYGPDDHSLIGLLMERFYRGQLYAVPAPEFTVTYAHVEDIAEGIILAAEKGRVGESYILAGPAVPLGEVIDFWGQLTGRRPPVIRVPARLVSATSPLLSAVEDLVDLPQPFSAEAARMMNVSYMARADKARSQLGWRTRSMQEGMSETFRHIGSTAPPPKPVEVQIRQRRLAAATLLLAALFIVLWLFGRRRD